MKRGFMMVVVSPLRRVVPRGTGKTETKNPLF